MAVLYVKEQGAYVRRKNERVLVSKGTETLLEIPVANLTNMAVIGSVQVTAQALQMLMTRGVDVNYFPVPENIWAARRRRRPKTSFCVWRSMRSGMIWNGVWQWRAGSWTTRSATR